MTTYLATQNIPGYLPMADEPDTFESIEMAWDYLLSERNTDLDNYPDGPTDVASEAMAALAEEGSCGSVWGPTPGYDGDHDLGLVYSVTVYEPEA